MPADENKMADNVTKLINAFHELSEDMDLDSEGAALA